MAAPSYTTDLADVTLCTTNTGWSELTGHGTGGADATETDYYIQGTACVSQSTGTATGTTAGLEFDYGSNITLGTGDCFFVWQIFLAANAIDTWANGGIRFGVGSSSGNIKFWKAVGNDFGRNPYGGWQNTAVDPTFTADYTEGTPTGTYRIFGSWLNLTASVTKGNPHGVDAIRWGRGEVIIEHGSLADGYGTFAGISTQNDNTNNRWGLFQKQGITYLWKGLLSFGNTTNACDFRDANVNISVDDTPRTYAAFNKIEINNASSTVEWTAVNIAAANASQLSRGSIQVTAEANVTFDSCTFTDMDTFTFTASSTVTDSIFRRCNAITAPGTNMSGSQVIASTVAANTSALVWNVNLDPAGELDDMVFTKGTNAHHAIEFGTTSPTTLTLNGLTFSGFNASNGQNDSAIHIKRTTGTVTINTSGVTGTVSYKTDGATVSIVNSVTLTLTGLKNPSEVRVYDAGTTTEIAGQESVTTGTFTTGIDGATYPDVDIAILSLGYQNIRLLGIATTSDVSIPIQQTIDRQYLNP